MGSIPAQHGSVELETFETADIDTRLAGPGGHPLQQSTLQSTHPGELLRLPAEL